MVTKAIIQSIRNNGTRCIVRMPLFESASNDTPVEAEALVSITPGLYNNLAVGDVVFIAFEENALEKPIIIGKLFKGATYESRVKGGASILDTLKVNNTAVLPASTAFEYDNSVKNDYKNLDSPKKLADYVKWLEIFFKSLISLSDEHFRCFKNWTQWHLQPENVVIDDGDIDVSDVIDETPAGLTEGSPCTICDKNCSKNKTRSYLMVNTDKNYPNI